MSETTKRCEWCDRECGRPFCSIECKQEAWLHAAAPRDPAAGATPAREETLASMKPHPVNDALLMALTDEGLVATLIDSLIEPHREARQRATAVLLDRLAALRERDAAREDAARGDEVREDEIAARVSADFGGQPRHLPHLVWPARLKLSAIASGDAEALSADEALALHQELNRLGFEAEDATAFAIHRRMCDEIFSRRQRYYAAMQAEARRWADTSVAWPDVLTVLGHDLAGAIIRAARAAAAEGRAP